MSLKHPTSGRVIFQHKPLNLSSNEIRLLTVHPDLTINGLIQCSLDHVTQSNAKYSCLSYMWGDEINQQLTSVNGCSLSIRSNLWNFLDIARCKLHSTPFWIDAVCIDQANTQEKNHQVAMMGEIYKQAKTVYAFLGTGDPALGEVMRFLPRS